MMMPRASPAISPARGLDRPVRAATVEGSPNTPPPMVEFTTSATRLHRPIARTNWPDGAAVRDLAGVSNTGFVFSLVPRADWTREQREPRWVPAWTLIGKFSARYQNIDALKTTSAFFHARSNLSRICPASA